MFRRPPSSTRTYTLFPYTTLFRSDPGLRLAVRGDPTRLRQVLSNLLSNAVKFTERGAVTLSVMRKGETQSHHQVRFEVRDTGIGIPTEAAARLFQAVTQADTGSEERRVGKECVSTCRSRCSPYH